MLTFNIGLGNNGETDKQNTASVPILSPATAASINFLPG